MLYQEFFRTWNWGRRAGGSPSIIGRARIALALEHGTQVPNLTHGGFKALGVPFRGWRGGGSAGRIRREGGLVGGSEVA